MFTYMRPAITTFIAFTFLTGVLYPGLVTLISQIVFPYHASGSLIRQNDQSIGSAAEYQVTRVAKHRKMSEAKVRELVSRSTLGRQFGLLGEPTVNVLELNIALNKWTVLEQASNE